MLPPRRPVCVAKKTIWRFKVIIQPLMHRVHYCVRLLMLLPAVMSVSVHHMNKWANGLLGPRLLTGREWIDLTLRVWLQLCLRTCPKKIWSLMGFFFFFTFVLMRSLNAPWRSLLTDLSLSRNASLELWFIGTSPELPQENSRPT